MLVAAGDDLGAIGGDDVGADQAVGGEPVRAGKETRAAAQRVSGNAYGLGTRQWSQAVRRGGGDDVGPPRARPYCHGPARWVHRDRRHQRGLQKQTAVDGCHGSVPGGLDRQGQPVGASGVHRSADVIRSGGFGDNRGTRVDSAVP
jgi:hypothetical protein